jgi:stage V sporulation protein G
MMDVEVVALRKLDGDGNLKAFADVKVGGDLIIKGFSVVQGKRGVFVSMPRKAGKDGQWFDVLTPTDESLKKEFEEKVLEAYDQEGSGSKN